MSLPNTFEQLRYISSSGGAVIEITDVNSVNYPGYVGYDINIKIPTLSRTWGRYMGNNDLPPYPCINNNTSSSGSGSWRITSYINGSSVEPVVTVATSSSFVNVKVDNTSVYVNDVLESSSYQNLGWTTPGDTNVKDFGLFSTSGWAAGGAACSIGTCKLYTAGVLIRDLVPVKRLSDDVIGYYDLLSDTFYSTDNAAFTAGPSIYEGINKVVYNNHTLIDLTGDTVSESDVASGVTFHLPNGMIATGTGTTGNLAQQAAFNTSAIVLCVNPTTGSGGRTGAYPSLTLFKEAYLAGLSLISTNSITSTSYYYWYSTATTSDVGDSILNHLAYRKGANNNCLCGPYFNMTSNTTPPTNLQGGSTRSMFFKCKKTPSSNLSSSDWTMNNTTSVAASFGEVKFTAIDYNLKILSVGDAQTMRNYLINNDLTEGCTIIANGGWTSTPSTYPQLTLGA